MTLLGFVGIVCLAISILLYARTEDVASTKSAQAANEATGEAMRANERCTELDASLSEVTKMLVELDGKVTGTANSGITALNDLTATTTEQLKRLSDKLDLLSVRLKGEFYSCKPDIFEKTYEAVDDEVFEEAMKSDLWGSGQ